MSTTRRDATGFLWPIGLLCGCLCLTSILVIAIVVLVKVNKIEDNVATTVAGIAAATQAPFLSHQALNPLAAGNANRAKVAGLQHANAVRSVLDVQSGASAEQEQAMPELVEAKNEQQKRNAPNLAAPHLNSKGAASLAQRAREANKL